MAHAKEVEGLSQRLSEVKDAWYSTGRAIEGLVDRAGSLGSLRAALSEVSEGIKGFGEGMQDIGRRGEQLIPGLWKDLKTQETDVLDGTERFYRMVLGDLEAIGQVENLAPKLEALKKRQGEKSEKLKELETLGEEIGEEHARLSRAYEKETSQITEEAEKVVKESKKRFLKEVGSLFDGFEITDKKERRRLSLEELFNRLAEEPGYYRGVDVGSKGIGGIVGKRSDREVRLLFLEYKSRDIAKALTPIIKERNARLSKLEAQGRRVKELARAIEEVGLEKEAVGKALRGLEAEIEDLEKRGSEIERRFSTLDSLLATREAYLERFNGLNDQRNGLYTVIEGAVEGYVPLEKDIEKRELKEEVKRLKGELEALRSESEALVREKERLAEGQKEAEARGEKLEKENEKLKARFEELEAKRREAEEEIAARKKELKERQKEYAELEKRYGQAETELVELNARIDALFSARQKRPTQGGARAKTEEEKEIGKKIEALREREVA